MLDIEDYELATADSHDVQRWDLLIAMRRDDEPTPEERHATAKARLFFTPHTSTTPCEECLDFTPAIEEHLTPDGWFAYCARCADTMRPYAETTRPVA